MNRAAGTPNAARARRALKRLVLERRAPQNGFPVRHARYSLSAYQRQVAKTPVATNFSAHAKCTGRAKPIVASTRRRRLDMPALGQPLSAVWAVQAGGYPPRRALPEPEPRNTNASFDHR